jgi:hypothetical protein
MWIALVEYVIRRLPNSLSHVEHSMAGHKGINGVYLKLGKGNTKGGMVRPMGNLEAESMFLIFRCF